MKSFKEFINESTKLSKSEEALLKRFTKEDEIVRVVRMADNSNFIGASGASGKLEYAAAQSLIDKGLVVVVDRTKTGSYSDIHIKKVGGVDTSLSDYEVSIYNKIKEYEDGKHRDPRVKDYIKKLKKKELTALERLGKLGYVKYSTLTPKILKELS